MAYTKPLVVFPSLQRRAHEPKVVLIVREILEQGKTELSPERLVEKDQSFFTVSVDGTVENPLCTQSAAPKLNSLCYCWFEEVRCKADERRCFFTQYVGQPRKSVPHGTVQAKFSYLFGWPPQCEKSCQMILLPRYHCISEIP